MILKPWQFIVLAVASWLNKEQQAVIEYRDEEIRILKEKLGRKRLLLNDAQMPNGVDLGQHHLQDKRRCDRYTDIIQ